MNKIKKISKYFKSKQGVTIIFVIIFIIHVFFRFFNLENRISFGWDQVDNAWAAKDILVDNKYPLLGMVAKQNSGFYIGPLYYYYIAVFYWIFNLDPISSGVISGVTSIISFFVLFYVVRKLFGVKYALVAAFLHAVSYHVIRYEMIQWPINFIYPISLLIFYFLYKVLNGNYKVLPLLAVFVGFSFHLNFTSIYFPIIILLSLPFFPRNIQTLKYILISIPIFLAFLIPNIISEINRSGSSSRNMIGYLSVYFHGLHARRILQLSNDAFIEVGEFFIVKIISYLKFLIYPLFCYLYAYKKPIHQNLILCYLMGLWFLVPWLVMSVYSGEITNYYFAITRPIATILITYFIVYLLSQKILLIKISTIVIVVVYVYFNIQNYLIPTYRPLSYIRAEALKKINRGEKIEFTQGIPDSYIEYYYKRKWSLEK